MIQWRCRLLHWLLIFLSVLRWACLGGLSESGEAAWYAPYTGWRLLKRYFVFKAQTKHPRSLIPHFRFSYSWWALIQDPASVWVCIQWKRSLVYLDCVFACSLGWRYPEKHSISDIAKSIKLHSFRSTNHLTLQLTQNCSVQERERKSDVVGWFRFSFSHQRAVHKHLFFIFL